MIQTAMPSTSENWTYLGWHRSNSSYNYNAWTTRSRVTSSTWTRTRDKNRFEFFRANGYLPIYSYNRFRYWYDGNGTNGVLRYHLTNNSTGEVREGEGSFGWYNHIKNINSVSAGHWNALRAELTARINNQVRNQYYSVWETLWDGRKTANMVSKAISDTVVAINWIRRGQFTKAARILGLKSAPRNAKAGRSLSSNWLEYRYGWQPLYFTVYGEMKRQFDQIQQRPRRLMECKVFTSKSIREYQHWGSGDNSGSNESAYAGPPGYWRHWADSIWDSKGSASIWYEFENNGIASATSIGLTNPALVAWELLPLSFVVDWFVNVSDVLAQFDTWAGKRFVAGSQSFRTEFQEWRTVRNTSYPGWTCSKNLDAIVPIIRGTRLYREVMTTPPLVPLNIGVSLSTSRVLDSIALLKQFAR